MNELVLLKLGGSLITDKTKPYTPLLEVMDDLAFQIAVALNANRGMRLVIGHGAGSFGHVPASEYHTRDGLLPRATPLVYRERDETQENYWKGFAEVWYQASSLNRHVMEALHKAGLRTIALPLGHILHLLAELSIPSHVKVVDHGISINSLNSGTVIDPDLLDLIVEEYELALSGWIPLPGILYIPNLLDQFRSVLNTADSANIPDFSNWDEYFIELGQMTYNHPVVNQFYIGPTQNGGWGIALNENGTIAYPTQYGITPPVQLNGRWVQFTFKSTANSNGTIIPESKMLEMCNDLVPKAVEYGAGLLLHFYEAAVRPPRSTPPSAPPRPP